MDDETDLKHAVVEKLEKNGTLSRIQAELRAAIFLAIEDDSQTEELNQTARTYPLECALIYHFLRQNKLPASAAVFEKEVNGRLFALDELQEQLRGCHELCSVFSSLLTNQNPSSTPREGMTECQSPISDPQKISNNEIPEICDHTSENLAASNIEVVEKNEATNANYTANKKSLDLQTTNHSKSSTSSASSAGEGTEIKSANEILPSINSLPRLTAPNSSVNSRNPLQTNPFTKHLNDLLDDDDSKKTPGKHLKQLVGF
ncbi:unnamed protein product [Enterobius vermicularis]|uniref:LisH domain-containing protein n=1 Tax=Enterobius vermicularis TaxID=51028 RepID=A0A0N4V801_ENTVE|nr:unnamed protein product [Enterobius vermicularis]